MTYVPCRWWLYLVCFYVTIWTSQADAGVKSQLDLVVETPDGIALDAEVAIDGHLQDHKTPASYSVTAGEHKLVVTYSGRTWEGSVKILPGQVTKKHVVLSTRVVAAAYSVAFSVGGGIAAFVNEHNVPSDSYTGLLSAAVEGRTKRLPFSLQLRAIHVVSQQISGANDPGQADFASSSITATAITLAPVFYWAMVRQSAPEGSIFAAPTDRENFFALFLTLGGGAAFLSYDTYYTGQAQPTDQTNTTVTTYMGFGLYGQSKNWQGRGGLHYWWQKKNPSLGSFQATSTVGIVAEVGYIVGFGS